MLFLSYSTMWHQLSVQYLSFPTYHFKFNWQFLFVCLFSIFYLWQTSLNDASSLFSNYSTHFLRFEAPGNLQYYVTMHTHCLMLQSFSFYPPFFACLTPVYYPPQITLPAPLLHYVSILCLPLLIHQSSYIENICF